MQGSVVSVVIPVYNGERFLADAIQSVLDQPYRPVEIVVVDDGSEDASSDIARTFAEVRLLRQHNAGPSAARNAGIAVTSGEYVAFLDADDMMTEHKLVAQVGFLEDHPEIGCVLGRHEIFVEEGMSPPDWLQRDSVYGDLGGVQPQSAVVRRSVLDQVGGFDPSYRLAEGMEWLGRLRTAGIGIDVVPDVVTRRRIHQTNLTHQADAMRSSLVRSLKGRIDRRRTDQTTEAV